MAGKLGVKSNISLIERIKFKLGFTSANPKSNNKSIRLENEMLRSKLGNLEQQLEKANQRILELEAYMDVDPLTNLMNKRYFDRELNRAISYVGRYKADIATIFLDLDGFKQVNDLKGHQAGDKLLVDIAQTLCASIRASDMIARLGGDEFALLLWNMNSTDALAKADSLEAIIEEAYQTYDLSASCGIAQLRPQETAQEHLHRADKAMYARKKEKRANQEVKNRLSYKKETKVA